ncbi:hypothetical protein [Streptomyces tauricus]|uniref:hypothetical protein n=1 Tax=Streptomyces tauricus TaxID=68274 RepID=UPI0034482704
MYEAGQQTYAWVVAACDGREEAYDGRFSTAAADVLDDLAETGLGSDPSQEFVDFRLVARHIGMRLEAASGRGQTVRATLMDPSAPAPSFHSSPTPLMLVSPPTLSVSGWPIWIRRCGTSWRKSIRSTHGTSPTDPVGISPAVAVSCVCSPVAG